MRVRWRPQLLEQTYGVSMSSSKPGGSGGVSAGTQALERLLEGRLHDPFSVLAPQKVNRTVRLRAYLPKATSAQLVAGEHTPAPASKARSNTAARHRTESIPARQVHAGGVFEITLPAAEAPAHPRWRWWEADGSSGEAIDPYSFAVDISAFDRHLFNEGSHRTLWQLLGAHRSVIDGIAGTRFCVWAPNAERVSVVGDFNTWDGRRHLLQPQGDSGLWCLFVPEVGPGDLYRFELRTRDGALLQKSDPCGQAFQFRPATASVVVADTAFPWSDADWCATRTARQHVDAPISVYEVHLPSWQRRADGSFMNYTELAPLLADHAQRGGFTHIELLPITEHPFDGSWGYQTLGFFAPTSRCGSPDDLRAFIDLLHARGIGVLLDWVPGHFPKDPHGLARFDGTPLYEHADPRLGEQPDWQTLVFNHARNEVRGFLTGSALYWLTEFHFDGLRVDAVASMIYRDYSRQPGQWLPNAYGGRENLEAIEWLKSLNAAVHNEVPGALMIAEESTAWPGVTHGIEHGGLGFDLKWNMGWMHDTLQYLAMDPVHRTYHHDKLTFGALYSHSENFMLALSHDEVVHGKGSLLNKPSGDVWQRLAQLRLLYSYQWTLPGKKLLFMGGELAQASEWDHDGTLPWSLLADPNHRGVLDLLGDLNRLYRASPQLHADARPNLGFRWSSCADKTNSVISYLRGRDGDLVLIVLNFTPVPRMNYNVGVPQAGHYNELLNSDSARYGGSNVGNLGGVHTQPSPGADWPFQLVLSLPPLGALILQLRSD